MSFTVFLGNLPTWVTADDIKSWLNAENLVADSIKVIRNPETQESKGFAFIEAPNAEEMQSIIRRFDRAPLEERLLRANPAQPPKSKGPAPMSYGQSQGPGPSQSPVQGQVQAAAQQGPVQAQSTPAAGAPAGQVRPPQERGRRGGKKHKRGPQGPQSAFAEELAKAL